MNRPKMKSCVSTLFKTASKTSSSLLHLTAVVALLPCPDLGLEKSHTAEVFPDGPVVLGGMYRFIRSNMGSVESLNAPKSGPGP